MFDCIRHWKYWGKSSHSSTVSGSSRSSNNLYFGMGLLPDTYNCGLRMRRECRERFPHHRLQRKPLVSDHGIHHGTCMSGSLTRGGRENVPGIPGACATRTFTYLARGPLDALFRRLPKSIKSYWQSDKNVATAGNRKYIWHAYTFWYDKHNKNSHHDALEIYWYF